MSLAVALLLTAADPVARCAAINRDRALPDHVIPSELAVSPQVFELCGLDWMFGTWEVIPDGAVVFGPGLEPAVATIVPALDGHWLEIGLLWPSGRRELVYLGYDPERRRWHRVALDDEMNATLENAAGWTNGRAVFEGEIDISGGTMRVRHILERHGADGFAVTYEMRADGVWHPTETYRYRRRPVR